MSCINYDSLHYPMKWPITWSPETIHYSIGSLHVLARHVYVSYGPISNVGYLCWSHHRVYQALGWQTRHESRCTGYAHWCPVLAFPNSEYVHDRSPPEPTLTHHPTVVFTSYNQLSTRALPCLDQGTVDTSMWVTADTGPATRVFLGSIRIPPQVG